MTTLMSIFAIPALARALIALTASAIAFPSIGTAILSLELIPARFAVMHVALLGAAVGMIIGIDPTLAALLAALLCGILVAALGERGKNSAGGPLGLIMILSLAIAFILFYKTNVHAIEAFSLFWGNILALSEEETLLVVGTAIILPILLLLFFRPIMAVLYDKELAAASGYPARATYYALVVIVCLGVGLAMRMTGALLADATTILPALAARNLKKGFVPTLIWGIVFGLVNNLGGFFLALQADLPTSPAIILVGAALVLGTALADKILVDKVLSKG
jgi:zinc transport system permease protein